MVYRLYLVVCITILNIGVCLGALPKGFVYLDTVDPTILSSLRYYGKENFLGRPVAGYKAPRVILTKQAAQALSKAQAILKQKGYSIVVYDAYRPQTAVNDFMRWSKNPKDARMKKDYYPRVDKEKVFELGYVAEKSGHSRGSTVDISIVPLKKSLHAVKREKRPLEDGFEIVYLNDGTEDMGSSFDLFDKASHYENDLITPEHQKKRTELKEIMASCGFKNYAEEWWHFTLENEPFPETYFDFPVK